MREAFEKALEEDRYDQLTHLAFADWLMENGFDDEATVHREWTVRWQEAEELRQYQDGPGGFVSHSQKTDELVRLFYSTVQIGNFPQRLCDLGGEWNGEFPNEDWWHPYLKVWANLLRDIIGNPFRPISALWRECYSCGGRGRQVEEYQYENECPDCYGMGTQPNSPWLTPTVLSLAQAAYEERSQHCSVCGGAGGVVEHHAGERRPVPCPACDDEGVVDDGSLDPLRLLVLADALEEAGCDSVDLLQHLRWNSIPTNWGHHRLPATSPHVRGCWALDLILGKN